MKNYFNSLQHFINYMLKLYGPLDQSSLKMVYKMGFENKLSWEAKANSDILTDINGWLSKASSKAKANEGTKKIARVYDSTPKFDRLTASLEKLPGVYVYSTASSCLYVGMSSDLGSRARRSFIERILNNKLDDKVNFSYFLTDSLSDAKALEIIIIAKRKPVLNKITKYTDGLTDKIAHGYTESDKIICKR